MPSVKINGSKGTHLYFSEAEGEEEDDEDDEEEDEEEEDDEEEEEMDEDEAEEEDNLKKIEQQRGQGKVRDDLRDGRGRLANYSLWECFSVRLSDFV